MGPTGTAQCSPAQHLGIPTPVSSEGVLQQKTICQHSSLEYCILRTSLQTWPWANQTGTLKQSHPKLLSLSFSTDYCRVQKGWVHCSHCWEEGAPGTSLAYLHAYSLYLKTSHKQMVMLTKANGVYFTHIIWLNKKKQSLLLSLTGKGGSER